MTYTKTGGSADLGVSSSGAVTTTGTLAAGSYTATGTTSDPYGDTGTFTYTLTVTAVTITQVAPTSASTTTTASLGFTDQLAVNGNTGTVSYTQSSGGADLKVSSSGRVTTTSTLAAGDYTTSSTGRLLWRHGYFQLHPHRYRCQHHSGSTYLGQHHPDGLGGVHGPAGCQR